MAIRILHVVTRYRVVGGSERNLLHSVSRELERGFDVHVAVGTEDLHDDFPPQVHVHPLPDLVREVSPRIDVRALWTLRRLIARHQFDAVHTHQSKAGVIGRLAACRLVRTVLHTVHMASFGETYGKWNSALFLRTERRLASFTDRLVFVGADLQRRYLAAGVGSAEGSLIIRSAIPNLQSLIALRLAGAHVRERELVKLGISPDAAVILMVGALDARKRHSLAIRNLAPLLASTSTMLVIAGEGPELASLKRLCAELRLERSVVFTGFVGDVVPLFGMADVFVQASTVEGVPQTIVQAVAAGVPVVATEVDGVREAAPRGDPITVVPADGDALLASVTRAIEHPPRALAGVELVGPWLPSRVDRQLDAFHSWLESRVRFAPERPRPVVAGHSTGVSRTDPVIALSGKERGS